MTNLEIYNQVFVDGLKVNTDQLETLTYRSTPGWDSIGHMVLIAAMEDAFDIMMDTNDIIDFSSYETGKQILTKYNVVF
jgi:acyl carrier protein